MGFFEELLGGKPKWKEEPTSKASRQRIQDLGMATIQQPVQQIAPADPAQVEAYNAARAYAGSAPSPAYGTALQLATNYANAPTDVMSIPGFKGIWDKILSEGTQGSRNLQRALKLSGNAAVGSSRGRDMLGRQQGQIEEQLMGAALPFIQDIENKRYSATMALPGLATEQEAAEMRRAEVGQQAGALMQAIQQAINDAQYNAQMADLNFRFVTQPKLLQSTMINPQYSQSPGLLQQISETLEGVSKIGGQIGGITQGLGGLMPSFKSSAGGGDSYADTSSWMNQNAQAWNMF